MEYELFAIDTFCKKNIDMQKKREENKRNKLVFHSLNASGCSNSSMF